MFAWIKKFTHLTDADIFDVFIYRENWNDMQHYDGFEEDWDTKVFHYANPPFTQLKKAIKKCGDF